MELLSGSVGLALVGRLPWFMDLKPESQKLHETPKR